MQAIIAKVDGGYTVTTVLSIDGQVRVLSEKAVGSVDEAEEVAHALAMSNGNSVTNVGCGGPHVTVAAILV
jgi:hypothetical protein